MTQFSESGRTTLVRMYILLLHILLIVSIAWASGIAEWPQKAKQRSAEGGWSPFYKKTLLMHRRQDPLQPAGSVIVIGDSLVQGLALQSLDAQAVNYGISGDTTAGVINRLRWYQSMREAKLIIIAIGINDLAQSDTETISRNYHRIVAALPSNVPVILNYVIPVDESPMGLVGYNAKIAALNDTLAGICDVSAVIYCLDLAPLVAGSGVLESAYHTGDGLHLNDAGNRIWLSALKQSAGEIMSVASASN